MTKVFVYGVNVFLEHPFNSFFLTENQVFPGEKADAAELSLKDVYILVNHSLCGGGARCPHELLLCTCFFP